MTTTCTTVLILAALFAGMSIGGWLARRKAEAEGLGEADEHERAEGP